MNDPFDAQKEELGSVFEDEMYSYFVAKTPWRPGQLNGYVVVQLMQKGSLNPVEVMEPDNIPTTKIKAFIRLLEYADKKGLKESGE